MQEEAHAVWDWTIKVTDLAIIAATFIGPIVAVWASEWRAARKAQHDRKEWVFRTLMSTRGSKLARDHVSAINHIEFAFPKKKYPRIDDARVLYRKHLRTASQNQDVWADNANRLFADMLVLMAEQLNIPFTRAEITEESYIPDAYLMGEQLINEIRVLTLAVLKEGRPLNVQVFPPPQDAPAAASVAHKGAPRTP